MSGDSGNALERLLEQAARRVSGTALHPLEVLGQVRAAVEAAVRGQDAPNDLRVEFHAVEYALYASMLPQLRREIEAALDDFERRRGLHRSGSRRIAFSVSENVPAGTIRALARFTDLGHRDGAPPPGATARIGAERGLTLVLEDGAVVPVTHTPFTIGRGPGNDLLLPGFAVSRRHAELVRSEHGYALRDVGSRNGLVVNGRRLNRVELAPGIVVTVGDFALRLEQAP